MRIRRSLIVTLVAYACLVSPPPAAAAPLDHLTCFKVKDQKTFKFATADLIAAQAEFSALNCKVRPAAKLLCVPTTKFLNHLEEGTPLNIQGDSQTYDRLCYKVKCPKAVIPPGIFSDQFGSRELGKIKAKLLCTPGVSGVPPTTTTTTTLGCIDQDLDTYGDNCPAGPDCDDVLDQVHPGALEVCDGLDNDCDAGTPDGAQDPQLGAPCDGPDSDACIEGTRFCGSGSLECSDNTSSTPDICNGMDDDCNANTPDGFADPQVGVPCDGPDADLCNEGTQFCGGGTIQCSDISGNTAEICGDGIDNDCDGMIDEGC